MGFFTDKAKQGFFDRFIPLELNEDNVNTIYKRCLPTEDTPDENTVVNYLFMKKNGFSEDSNPLLFNKSKLQKEYKKIVYLLGQLKDVHDDSSFFYLDNLGLNYNNETWFQTSDAQKALDTVFKLIALGSTVEDEKGISPITPLVKEYNGCINIDILPTFSPKDHPAYDEWLKTPEGQKWIPESK